MTNLRQAVRILSKGKYTIGPEGTITSEDAVILEELLTADINRRNPGFTGSDLIRFKAYFILDALSNSSGTGQVIEKTVKDTRWKVAKSSGQSIWMDYIDQMIAEYHKARSDNFVPSGVSRCDSTVKGFDNSEIKQYGEPSESYSSL